jgi:hypothetical protein
MTKKLKTCVKIDEIFPNSAKTFCVSFGIIESN